MISPGSNPTMSIFSGFNVIPEEMKEDDTFDSIEDDYSTNTKNNV